MVAVQFEQFPVPVFILFFIILWMGVCKVLAAAGGWQMLARDYRANAPFDGQKMWLKSAGMRRWMNYNNCITVGANRYGLYLAVLPIFRLGHPPLFFPWTDLSTEDCHSRLFGDFVKFKFTRQPDIPVIFSRRLATRIFELKQECRPW
jgi:hypothetical protein